MYEGADQMEEPRRRAPGGPRARRERSEVGAGAVARRILSSDRLSGHVPRLRDPGYGLEGYLLSQRRFQLRAEFRVGAVLNAVESSEV